MKVNNFIKERVKDDVVIDIEEALRLTPFKE